MTAIKTDARGRSDGGICHVDGELVYMVMRELGVRHAIEFSPDEGYSTAFLYAALGKNCDDFTFCTFDIELQPMFIERMKKLDMNVRFCQGDALLTVPDYLEAHGLTSQIEFCFIDSDHSFSFASMYCAAIWPLLSPDCVFFVHDMCYRPHDFMQFSNYGPILAYEIGGTGFATGEAAMLCEYLACGQPKYEVFSTHRLFGDSHECSSILPRNTRLIDRLTREIPRFELQPSAGQEGGLPRPPMGLFVIPESKMDQPGESP